MTEKEKILCGEFYDTRDSGLRCLSNHAKDLMRVYNSLINMNDTLLDTGRITIGDNTLIGLNVKIYTAVHPVSAEKRIYTDKTGHLVIRTKSAPVLTGNPCVVKKRMQQKG